MNNTQQSSVTEGSDNHMTDEDIAFLTAQDLELPLQSNDLKRYLPHRYPFVMVDRVTHIKPSQSISGYKNISNSEPFVQGHFPDYPILPGVYIIEAMAQIAGILGFISDQKDLSDGATYLFAGVDKVRFKQQVIPGDQLLLTATALKNRGNIYTFSVTAQVADKKAASAEIMLVKQILSQ